MVKNTDGTVNFEFSAQLLAIFQRWAEGKDVSGAYDWVMAQKLGARTLYRDGEYLIQRHMGRFQDLEHDTDIPLSLEFIEADQLPMDFFEEPENVVQGIEVNRWGRPQSYRILPTHPGDTRTISWLSDAVTIPAEFIAHPKITDRFGQMRGVSIFASVQERLEDIKDIEESERIAARVAAAFSAVIIRGEPGDYEGPDDPTKEKDRSFKTRPGMVFDRLKPGESVETIDSKRPNVQVVDFRKGMLKAVAAGTVTNYSSIAREYNGSYSAQRQELVEGWTAYTSLQVQFASMTCKPVYKWVIEAAILAGLVRIPAGIDRRTLFDANYWGPVMPWVDPDRESKSIERMERSGNMAPQKAIRMRGENPLEVMQQIKQWRDLADENGLVFTSDSKHDKGVIETEEDDDSGQSEEDEENQVQEG
jgi:lambda family phage portal protein